MELTVGYPKNFQKGTEIIQNYSIMTRNRPEFSKFGFENQFSSKESSEKMHKWSKILQIWPKVPKYHQKMMIYDHWLPQINQKPPNNFQKGSEIIQNHPKTIPNHPNLIFKTNYHQKNHLKPSINDPKRFQIIPKRSQSTQTGFRQW